jgi:hypothetical protein
MIDECRCADSFTRSFTSSPHLPYARDRHILRSIVAEVRARTARSDAVPLKRFAAPLRRERQLGIHLGQQFSRFCILATACPPIPAIENPPFIHAGIGVGERPRAWNAWRSN